MIYEVEDNGWGDGITNVEVNNKTIQYGNWYLAFDKKGNPISIELCDSEYLVKSITNKKKYKKIIASDREISVNCFTREKEYPQGVSILTKK